MKTNYVGKKVIVRGDRSGLTYGTLESREGAEATISNARRLHYWSGACSIFQLALTGTTKPNDCRFTVVIPEVEIIDAIEVLPCSDEAIESIEGVKIWKA